MARFRGLLAASVVGASLIGAAHAGPFTTVDFSAFYNFNPQVQYGFPSGAQNFAGVPFQMTVVGGNDSWHTNFDGHCGALDCSITVPVGVAGATHAFTLLSTWWGFAGTTGGSVVANGSHGDHFTYLLTANGNIRDYNPNPGTSNLLLDPSAQQVFANGSGQRVDMQTITLPGVFASETLDSVTIHSAYNIGGFWQLFIQGLTVESIPEPGTLALFGVGLAGLAWSRRRPRG
jgi:hypothetical protein